MRKVYALAFLFLAGCATVPNRNITVIEPTNRDSLDFSSNTHGYIALSGFYQQITYGNLGGVSQDYIRAADVPNRRMHDASNRSFAPVGSVSSAFDLSLHKYKENKLMFYKVPAGKYQKWSGFGRWLKPLYQGGVFEVKSGEVVYFGHYHEQIDLERNVIFGDHYEQICRGVANKIYDAENVVKKMNPSVRVNDSLVSGFKMLYPNKGRKPCSISTIK